MMEEPGRILALEHLVRISAEVEVQLASPEWEPIKAVLVRAQDEAANAIVGLMDVDATEKDVISELQTRACRYRSLVTWLREIMAEGKEAASEIDEAKAERARNIIGDLDEDTRVAMGLKEPGAPTE